MAVAFDKSLGTAFDTSGAAENLGITVPTGGVASGDIVVVTAGWVDSSRTLASVTDAGGNTYRVDVTSGPRTGTNDFVGIAVGYISSALSAGGTIGVHWSGTGGVGPSMAARADAFSGWSAIPALDSGGTHTNPQSAVTAPTTGVLNTTNANDLLIACCASGNAGNSVITGDASWSNLGTANTAQAAGLTHQGNFSQYRIVAATSGYSATMADATTTNWFSAIVAYQLPAAGAAVTTVIPRILMAPHLAV